MSPILNRLMQARKFLLFFSEFSGDLIAYARYCGVSPLQDSRKKLYYRLIIEAHTIEKGLSLPNRRLLFGRAKIALVMSLLRKYGVHHNDFPVLMAIGALKEYLSVHREASVTDRMLDEIDTLIAERDRKSLVPGSGGLRHFYNGWPGYSSDVAGGGLLSARFSCRMFNDVQIEHDTVLRIVSLAQRAPSQCNRQATKVHFYNEREKIRELLRLQQGSTGFADTVGGLFVISFDLAAWGGAQQRNQGYVDAALFCQNLMLAAHALGVASCPLNLAVSHSAERAIRLAGAIPSDQRLVMMIAIGWPLQNELRAAASPRRDVGEILTFHNYHTCERTALPEAGR